MANLWHRVVSVVCCWPCLSMSVGYQATVVASGGVVVMQDHDQYRHIHSSSGLLRQVQKREAACTLTAAQTIHQVNLSSCLLAS